MVVARFADLHKQNFSAKMIHYLLVSSNVPPFDGEIILAARCDYPEGNVFARELLNLRVPRLFQVRDVNVAFELSGLDPEVQRLVQELDITMQKMIRRLITLVDQRVVAIDDLDVTIMLT